MRAYNAPEARRMIALHEMGQLVYNYIVDNKHRRFYETPVEVDVVIDRAGTPSVAVIDDLGLSKRHSQSVRYALHASENFLFRPSDIPFPQHITTPCLVRARHDKEAVQFNFSAIRFCKLDTI